LVSVGASSGDAAHMLHPMQYDLERSYHASRQQSAARQRQVAEAARPTIDAESQTADAELQSVTQPWLARLVRTAARIRAAAPRARRPLITQPR
jgi:hypothetical protein